MEIKIQTLETTIGGIGEMTPIHITQPGQLRVIKRDGRVAAYDVERISAALKKAFLAVEGERATDSSRIQEIVSRLTSEITHLFHKRWPEGGTIHIEAIQDKVELSLMHAGLHKVARSYVLYREERRKQRENQATLKESKNVIHVTLDNGCKEPLDSHWLSQIVHHACHGLEEVSTKKILEDTKNNLFDGVALKDVYKALVMTARTLI